MPVAVSKTERIDIRVPPAIKETLQMAAAEIVGGRRSFVAAI